jgi:hypothetical protein
VAVLYISPAFNFYSARTAPNEDQRYVLIEGDILARTMVTASPSTVTPTATQNPPRLAGLQSLNTLSLHELATYLETGSPSRAQIISEFQALRDIVLARAIPPLGASGDLQVTLTWSAANDVDLYVTEPNGTQVYYRTLTGPSGSLDHDDQYGTGPENYRVLGEEGSVLEVGTYAVGVNYYRRRTEGSVAATVTVTTGGATQSRTVTLSTDDQGATIVPVFTIEVARAPAGSATPYLIRVR